MTDGAPEEPHNDNVELFPGPTKQPFSADMLLREAIKADLPEVIILGWDRDDTLYMVSNLTTKPEMLWAMEKAKLALLTPDAD